MSKTIHIVDDQLYDSYGEVMARTVILNGRDIGEAQRATTAVLLQILTSADTDFETWAVLNSLAERGVPVPREPLVELIAEGLGAGESWVEKTVDDAETAGLLRIESAADGEPAAVTLTLTPSGVAYHRELKAAVDQATDVLFADIPRSELRTAQRVLATVTTRATGWLRDASTDDKRPRG